MIPINYTFAVSKALVSKYLIASKMARRSKSSGVLVYEQHYGTMSGYLCTHGKKDRLQGQSV